MEKNLSSYVKVYDNWFTSNECDNIIIDSEKQQWNKHFFQNYYSEEIEYLSGDKELECTYISNHSILELMRDKIWHSIFQYLSEFEFSWFNTWSGFSRPRINKYIKDQKMAVHCDHIKTLFEGSNNSKGIPIITILASLNDNYTGGKLIMFEDEEIILKKGSIVLFPSNFLFPHQVTPVETGVRYSFVSWAW